MTSFISKILKSSNHNTVKILSFRNFIILSFLFFISTLLVLKFEVFIHKKEINVLKDNYENNNKFINLISTFFYLLENSECDSFEYLWSRFNFLFDYLDSIELDKVNKNEKKISFNKLDSTIKNIISNPNEVRKILRTINAVNLKIITKRLKIKNFFKKILFKSLYEKVFIRIFSVISSFPSLNLMTFDEYFKRVLSSDYKKFLYYKLEYFKYFSPFIFIIYSYYVYSLLKISDYKNIYKMYYENKIYFFTLISILFTISTLGIILIYLVFNTIFFYIL